MARTWEDRVAACVDSPFLRRRVKVGTTIACTVRGSSGTYNVRANLRHRRDEACTCPAAEGYGGCKHAEALRRTYQRKPASFTDVDALLEPLAGEPPEALLQVIRKMVLHAPRRAGRAARRGRGR